MNFAWIKVTMKYRNGEQTVNICSPGDSEDDFEDVAVSWADSTGCGANYGYRLYWDKITDKETIKIETLKLIEERKEYIVAIEEEINKLKIDLTNL